MPSREWQVATSAFTQAADWYAELVAACPDDGWGSPGLGEWTVRDLVGHTSRSLLTVEAYLRPGPGPVDLETPSAYFTAALASIGDPAAVSQRGVAAGEALGADPVGAVREIRDRVVALVSNALADDHVDTPVGAMRLIDYLPTRTFELTVHTCDLAIALGTEPRPPADAARVSLALISDRAVAGGAAATLLLAATGRHPLPGGFTVL
ncbi:maleylpyruvate isomerase family mycothiol-dependent enzyme [Nocardioides sp.]|uniref:maleylpyruvate isomerase family mycothiol-dependent enzyme n=1 Tax=Nocardioides sp. TaxID=35761 RepID=UPI003D10DE8A